MSPLQRQYKKLQCNLQEITARVLTPQRNSIYKDNANERQKSMLLVVRVQLVLYKDNANERQKSLLLFARVQLVLYKDK